MPLVDVLMITYQRPDYVRLSLERLIETAESAGSDVRVWLWHNGDDQSTLAEARKYADHPNVARFHHSRENKRLREPTNWLWSQTEADYVSKVDDDCLVADDWVPRLVAAHESNPEFGIVGSWRFPDEDFEPDVAAPKIREFSGGHRLLQNFWVQGSGYLMKRSCIERFGILEPQESFAAYGIRTALGGAVNGWLFPFLREEHMDDPRSPYTLLTSDEELRRYLPLSAQQNGVTDLASWTAQMRRSAAVVQRASIDPADYRGWRHQIERVRRRVKRSTTGTKW